jgi:hypothetical protein
MSKMGQEGELSSLRYSVCFIKDIDFARIQDEFEQFDIKKF